MPNLANLHRKEILLVFLITVVVGLLISGANNEDSIDLDLTPAEEEWLLNHPVITIGPDPGYPPVEYIDDEGNYRGLSADYLRWIQDHTDLTFKVVEYGSWNTILDEIKDKKLDMLGAASKTDLRSQYMLFTEPYIELPTVIIGSKTVIGNLDVSDLEGLKVAVVSNYAIHDYLVITYPDLDIEAVQNMETGVKKVSFGMVDVLIGDMGVASYTIENMGITNLKVVGIFDYKYELAFAVRDDYVELQSILQKALDAMPQDVKRDINQNWVSLKKEGVLTKDQMLIGLAVFLSTVIVIIVWNRSLKHQVSIKTDALKKELIERVAIEGRLESTQKTLRQIIDLLPHIIYAKDNNGRFIIVNKALANFHDLPVDMMEGHLDVDIYGSDFTNDISKYWYGDQDVKEQNQPVFIPSQTLNDSNGNQHIYQFRKIPFRLNHTDQLGVLGVGVEISELKKAEQELAVLNEELEMKVEKRTELLNDSNYRLQLSMRNLKEKQAELEDINAELETSLSSLKDAQFKLVESEKMAALGRLLAGLAHEINTPVGIGITLTSYISDEAEKLKSHSDLKALTRKELDDFLLNIFDSTEVLLRNLETASQMIDDFKNIAKDQRGNELQTFILNQTLEKIIHSLQPKFESTPYKIKLDCEKDIHMKGYAGMLYQVLSNLILNAKIHGFKGRDHGIIQIQAKRVFDNVVIIVQDDGVGISNDADDKVFEPLYTTQRSERTGLGLNIVYNTITQIMGGSIDVERVNDLTRFKMIIPIEVDTDKIIL